jgi:hypothetical protein
MFTARTTDDVADLRYSALLPYVKTKELQNISRQKLDNAEVKGKYEKTKELKLRNRSFPAP